VPLDAEKVSQSFFARRGALEGGESCFYIFGVHAKFYLNVFSGWPSLARNLNDEYVF